MQEIGDGSGGRFIGVGDRRLRPHSHHQALKCPRCDSLNTKFCYYNNYNLSQPRHFCKSCRRYWTKGGVLRTVPVGGGCRKNKRSNSKAKSEARESKSHARSSSSESSSLTAAAVAATAAGAAAAEEGSAPTSESLVLCNFPDARYSNVNHEPLVDHLATDGQIFSAEMGSLTSLMTSSEEMMGFGVADISYGRDQTVRVAEDPSPATAEEFKIGDWGSGGGDRDLFDLTAEVDPSYWSQTEWNDDDQRV